jgi:hypothetical protein
VTVPIPQPSVGGEQQPEHAGPRFFWVPGSVENGVELSGPVPPEAMPDYEPDGLPARLDWKALIDGLAAAGKLGSLEDGAESENHSGLEDQPDGKAAVDQQHQRQDHGDRSDPQPDAGGEQAAEPQGDPDPALDAARLAALAVEHMRPGPALAGWLEVTASGVKDLDEDGLTGLALATRKQVARAQALHLTAIAELVARAAAADPNVGLQEDGRPVQVTRDAAGQVEMALNLSHEGAQVLTDLALTLAWRLPTTGAVLATGDIDLDRAKIIVQSTSVLTEDLARQVEAKILPHAAGMTTAQLRRRLTVLVIIADPAGADQRRKDAERLADVRLYADDDHTATLIADRLPQVLAAAGYARINALAWARKKAGLPGSIKQHRAHIILELIMGTLEFIPPPEGAPPDQPPPPDDDPPPSDDDRPPSDDDQPPPHQPPPDSSRPGEPPSGQAGPRNAPAHPRSGHYHPSHGNGPADSAQDDQPAPRDEDAPDDDGLGDGSQEPGPELDPWDPDDLDPASPPVVWPQLGTVPPALARTTRRQGGIPPAALLDLTLPWTSYVGLTDLPGILGRTGAITAAQARPLIQAAEHDPAAQWRIIITSHEGHALAVTRIRRHARRRRRGPPGTGPPATGPPETGPPGTGPPAGPGLTGRITLIISEDTIVGYLAAASSGLATGARTRRTRKKSGLPSQPRGVAAAALRAAARVLQRARELNAADTEAGGCAHTSASPLYRPPTRLREHVIARDQTCRSPVCGQPAWRADLDHTIAYDQGGRTCPCNLGGACRREHQLKQHPRWKLEQTRPGWFRWTAPSGRTYTTGPETYTA